MSRIVHHTHQCLRDHFNVDVSIAENDNSCFRSVVSYVDGFFKQIVNFIYHRLYTFRQRCVNLSEDVIFSQPCIFSEDELDKW